MLPFNRDSGKRKCLLRCRIDVVKLWILYAVEKTLGVKIREIYGGFGIGELVDLSARALSVEDVIPRTALPTNRLPCKRLHRNFIGITFTQNLAKANGISNAEVSLHTYKARARQAEIVGSS